MYPHLGILALPAFPGHGRRASVGLPPRRGRLWGLFGSHAPHLRGRDVPCHPGGDDPGVPPLDLHGIAARPLCSIGATGRRSGGGLFAGGAPNSAAESSRVRTKRGLVRGKPWAVIQLGIFFAVPYPAYNVQKSNNEAIYQTRVIPAFFQLHPPGRKLRAASAFKVCLERTRCRRGVVPEGLVVWNLPPARFPPSRCRKISPARLP